MTSRHEDYGKTLQGQEASAEEASVVVVGAGPGGLCAAAAARAAGLGPVILERSFQVGGLWSQVPGDLRCLSPRHRDLLPDESYPRGPGQRASAAEVQAALQDFADKENFDIRFGVRATGVSDLRAGELGLGTSSGPFRTRRLVVATGEFGRPRLLELDGKFSGPSCHSSQVDLEDIDPKEHVLVVGSANSAVDLVGRLVKNGNRVTVSARSMVKPPKRLPVEPLSSLLWWLSALPMAWLPPGLECSRVVPSIDDDLLLGVQEGHISLVGETVSLDETGLRTADGQRVDADRIIFATGFRRDLAWVTGITLDEDGLPLHDEGLSTEIRGLAFIGLPCMRTRRSGFLRGLNDDARTIIARLR